MAKKMREKEKKMEVSKNRKLNQNYTQAAYMHA